MRIFVFFIILFLSTMLAHTFCWAAEKNKPLVGFALSEALVDAGVSYEMVSTPSEMLSDCTLTYRILSSTGSGEGPHSKVNLLKKSNYFERAYWIKSGGTKRATVFERPTLYQKMLEDLEDRAVTENPKLAKTLMDTIFAKDQECSFLIKGAVDTLMNSDLPSKGVLK